MTEVISKYEENVCVCVCRREEEKNIILKKDIG